LWALASYRVFVSSPGATPWARRLVTWGLALAALVFVAYAVPLRDRCPDPTAEVPRKVPVTRLGDACVLHTPRGEVRAPREACPERGPTCEPGLVSALGRARLGLVGLLGALYLAGTFAWALRWHTLLRLANVPIPVLRAWRVTLEAQAGGVLLPGGVAGDALRVASIVGHGAPAVTVAASVLLDRAIGLATLAGLAAGLAAAIEPSRVGPAVLLLAGVPVALALGLGVLRASALRRAKLLERPFLARTAKPVLEYLGDARAPGAIGRALLVSLVVSAVQLALIRGLCTALGEEPLVERWVYTGAAMSFVVGVLPALPGGWGTSDAAFVFFLDRAGIGASTAFAVCLVYRMYWYAVAVLGAVLALRARAMEPVAARRDKKDAG
jgi:uncharacterized membrane protein YbhN (UPF0104 family)